MVISNLKIGTSYFFTLLKEFAKENIRYQSEIEDVFNPASYLDFINERYDIHLVSKDLNGNLKWSEKIGKILNGKGKSFEKEDITDLKQSVAEKIAKNMKKAYDKQQCPALYDFIKNIEKKILHSNH